MALLTLWMSLVGVNSMGLGPNVLGPGGVRLGFRFSLFLPLGVLVIGLSDPIGVMGVPGWG